MPTQAAKPCQEASVYQRRRPERTLLYHLVQAHLATWLALQDDGEGRSASAPALVEREFRRYLDCGILAHGFARARCADCGHDFIVAYSCKGRGVCPSCTTRRMVETAAHLVDHVFPALPVRQWVLSLPKRLRYHLDDAKLQSAVLHSFLRAIEQGLRQSLPEGDGTARIGAVVFIHRFGALMNAHLHFHVIAIDGVFFGEETASLRFEETHLSAQALARLQSTLRKRIVSLFVRRGLLDSAEGEALRRCAHGGGFSLDAGVRIEGDDRQGRERLLRYCARPAFAQERLRQIDAEHLVYESPKPGPGGRVSQILTPLELLDRLAALIPPPRRHRHRYYGVLAPNAPLRSAVTALAAAPKPPSVEADAVAEESAIRRAARYAWALLLARIYEVFPLTCPKCGGAMRIIAFIDEGEAIRKILQHLGEPIEPPKLAPARGPPLWEAAGQGHADPLAQSIPEFEFDQRIAW
ncbi:MAG TPA: transposase [Pseudomonadales bacterium]|nr:transposase [Pseudomonadales bacterium]